MKTLVKFHWFLANQLGLDPLRLFSFLRGLPLFIRNYRQFRKGYSGRLALLPCLHDRTAEGGITKDEYFWQDLLVARWVHQAMPERHVDIGSRIDGFVSHVASFREIEVFDVRPITSHVPGIVFRQADLMNNDLVNFYAGENGYCDSLSCLHAIEHFGLGRYNDPIDVYGYEYGIANMAKLLKQGGTFYLSTPIGHERVEFNANWIFDPQTIIRCAGANGLNLRHLTIVSSTGQPTDVLPSKDAIDALAASYYNLGVFVFEYTGIQSE